jgi:NAD(P)-dependent dehydrogenase (short-subunit alcohol dehydrogenase family)
LGVETARTLVAHGATVVSTARDLTKARHALAKAFSNEASNLPIDLVRSGSRFAQERPQYGERPALAGKPFGAIIAKAGVTACPQGKLSTTPKYNSEPITWALRVR